MNSHIETINMQRVSQKDRGANPLVKAELIMLEEQRKEAK
jgi:hypothetical protein